MKVIESWYMMRLTPIRGYLAISRLHCLSQVFCLLGGTISGLCYAREENTFQRDHYVSYSSEAPILDKKGAVRETALHVAAFCDNVDAAQLVNEIITSELQAVSALGSKQIKDCMDEKPGQILWPFLQDKMQNIFYKVSPNI
ncbi:hypothetical protein Q9966_009938 [Columba livia]|nr:hypothetical protein Q9966_009938 [Columba livia]